MDIMQNVIWIAVGIALLLLLRQILKRMSRQDSDIDGRYRKILASDEHKVKGRFD